jgi:hypothetical protein
MAYLILGLAALTIWLLAMRAFARANPAWMARRLTVAGGVASLLAAGVLFLRGFAAIAVPLAMLGTWLLWGGKSGPWGIGGTRRTPGQTSRIATEHLEMELDHDTGEMHGRVLKGLFKDRQIESLSPADMALLAGCRHADPVGSAHRGLPRSRAPDVARGHGARRIRHEPGPRRAHDV